METTGHKLRVIAEWMGWGVRHMQGYDNAGPIAIDERDIQQAKIYVYAALMPVWVKLGAELDNVHDIEAREKEDAIMDALRFDGSLIDFFNSIYEGVVFIQSIKQ